MFVVCIQQCCLHANLKNLKNLVNEMESTQAIFMCLKLVETCFVVCDLRTIVIYRVANFKEFEEFCSPLERFVLSRECALQCVLNYF